MCAALHAMVSKSNFKTTLINRSKLRVVPSGADITRPGYVGTLTDDELLKCVPFGVINTISIHMQDCSVIAVLVWAALGTNNEIAGRTIL